MSFYRWAMRNGAQVLFVFSLLVFIVAFVGQLALGWSAMDQSSFLGEPSQGRGGLWLVLSALASALQSSGTLFAAACIVHLLDGRASAKRGEGL